MSTPPIIHRRVTRRELLNYAWLSSMALLLAKAGSAAFVFALPRFPLQTATVPVSQLPAVNGEPLLLDVEVSPAIAFSLPNPEPNTEPSGHYRIFLSQTDVGIRAFMNRCTHLGCIFPWSEAAGLFGCPCHGSQFKRDGDWVAGPAPRALDRFPITAIDAQGKPVGHSDEAGVLALPDNTAWIVINHSTLILGRRHA